MFGMKASQCIFDICILDMTLKVDSFVFFHLVQRASQSVLFVMNGNVMNAVFKKVNVEHYHKTRHGKHYDWVIGDDCKMLLAFNRSLMKQQLALVRENLNNLMWHTLASLDLCSCWTERKLVLFPDDEAIIVFFFKQFWKSQESTGVYTSSEENWWKKDLTLRKVVFQWQRMLAASTETKITLIFSPNGTKWIPQSLKLI